MQFLNKKSPFSFFFLIKNMKKGIILPFFILIFTSGIFFILMDLFIRMEITSKDFCIRLISLFIIFLGICMFCGGLIPLIFKKTHSFLFYDTNKYSECITALVAIVAIGFFFFFLGMARIIMGF